jgi:hypothetical protein
MVGIAAYFYIRSRRLSSRFWRTEAKYPKAPISGLPRRAVGTSESRDPPKVSRTAEIVISDTLWLARRMRSQVGRTLCLCSQPKMVWELRVLFPVGNYRSQKVKL